MNKKEILMQKVFIYKKMRDNPESAVKILKEEQEKLIKKIDVSKYNKSKQK